MTASVWITISLRLAMVIVISLFFIWIVRRLNEYGRSIWRLRKHAHDQANVLQVQTLYLQLITKKMGIEPPPSLTDSEPTPVEGSSGDETP